MFIQDVVNSGSIPTLEAAMRFAARRHEVITHTIANLDTPNFIARDVSPRAFQSALQEAVADRRQRTGGEFGPLRIARTREIAIDGRGNLQLSPRTPGQGILFQDRNNRDLERSMQDLVENGAAFRVATDLLRDRYRQIRDAIGERV